MPSHPSLPDLAVVSAHRARIQAARVAAFAEPNAGLVFEPRPRDVDVFFFGELAQPETLRRFLERAAGATSPVAPLGLNLKPARVVKHDLVTFNGKDILVPTAWWHEGYSRFPEPGADGMLVRGLRSDVVAPLLRAYYGEDCEERPVTVLVDGDLRSADAYVWEGRWSQPPGLQARLSTRRMFFYGSLTDPDVLRRILNFRLPLTLTPAVLHTGWRLRRWGQHLALVPASSNSDPVEGVIFDCPGPFIDRLEKYEGKEYAPTEVQVVEGGATQSISAWCYVWNGAPEDLQD